MSEGEKKFGVLEIVPELTDEVLLEASESIEDNFSGIVAEKIRALNIQQGIELLIPVNAIIKRYLFAKERNKCDNLDSTLYTLRKQLLDCTNSFDQMEIGLKLGDAGLIVHAGYRRLSALKQMHKIGISHYAKACALEGYEACVDVASRKKSEKGKALNENITPLIERFEDVSDVVCAVIGGARKHIPAILLN